MRKSNPNLNRFKPVSSLSFLCALCMVGFHAKLAKVFPRKARYEAHSCYYQLLALSSELRASNY